MIGLSRITGRQRLAALASAFVFLVFLSKQLFFDVESPVGPQTPSPSNDGKVVVMARLKSDDTDWVDESLTGWQHAVYHVDEPAAEFHTPKNKGREAMAYLTYVIDFYDHLPKTIAFIHPHRAGWPGAWHNDAAEYDAVHMLTNLREDFVQAHGYANLRCLHNPGCPAEIHPFRVHALNEEGEMNMPHEVGMAKSWIEIFGGSNSSVPEVIATPCCSQFAVSRTQIRARPKSEYEHYRKWLLDTELDDYTSGRIFEYLWHIIFGAEAVHCPEPASCHCEQFGQCPRHKGSN